MAGSLSVACSICLGFCGDAHNEDDFVSIKCGHAFHRSCLLEWKYSSRKMECPECRQKYTARTLTKLFLNPVFKEENFENDPQYLKLQEEQKKLSELQNDNRKILTEKKEMEFELLKSRDEFQLLSRNKVKLREEYEIKCQAYDIVSMVNDEYLKANNALQKENTQLEQKNNRLQREITVLKAEQLKMSKPFVDLTCDDDSDVEIVDEKKLDGNVKILDLKPSEVIEVNDDPVENKEDCKMTQQPNSEFLTTLQEFECFILESFNERWNAS